MPRKQKDIHYIYKTTNLINKNFYIGMHSTNNLDDGYLGSGLRLRRSIRKYGEQNFKKEILEYCLTREELSKRENEIVNSDLIKDALCMNLMIGGENVNGIGPLNTFYGKKHTEEHKKYMSDKIKEWCSNNKDVIEKAADKRKETLKAINFNHKTFEGKQHTEESKIKIKESSKGKHCKELNSQYGTMWITNGIENKKIKTNDIIPKGYYKGRKIKRSDDNQTDV